MDREKIKAGMFLTSGSTAKRPLVTPRRTAS
jgi:hypothetical protein